MDTPGVSQALIVAEQQGMTPSVIARAQELLPQGAVELGALLTDLEKQRVELDKRLAEAGLMRRRVVEEKEKWEKRQKRLRERMRELERDQSTEREAWLREKRAEIEKNIANLDSKRELLQLQKEVQQLQEEEQVRAEQLRRETVEDSGQLADLKPGARVRVQDFNDEGRIVSVDLDRLRAVVALRKITVETPLDKLQLLVNQEEHTDSFGGVRVNVHHEPVPNQLDLHGQRVDEALEGLDAYLSRALLQQMPQVTVIHGHGTGALRTAIHERLRQHPQIRRFRFGNEGEGGGAVTIIELR
jgi:DNA mismatch repair protein MutS2